MQMTRRGRTRTREKVYAVRLRTGSLCSSESVARVNTSKQRESGWNTLSRMAASLFSSMALTQILIGQGRFKATRTCDFSNQEFIEHTKRGAEFLRPLNFQWLVVIILEG